MIPWSQSRRLGLREGWFDILLISGIFAVVGILFARDGGCGKFVLGCGVHDHWSEQVDREIIPLKTK